MTSFIVHARGFVLETTSQLLREHGAPVIEAPHPQQAASHLAESPTAVLVCNDVPPADCWKRRRVVLLDGISDGAVARLVEGGARVTRPERGSLQAFLDAAFRVDTTTPDAAILRLPHRRAERPLLTRRQLEVVDLIARGLTSQEIADELGVRPKTVENYKQRLFARLGVQNQAHAVARCAHLGLIGERPVATLAS
jgi:DNA-binding CsgD family transcriptional regulator